MQKYLTSRHNDLALVSDQGEPFPLVEMNTQVADFAIYPDGSISIGQYYLDIETMEHLVAFLAMPSVRQHIELTATKAQRESFLADLTNAIEDEREVAA
jgi:hypothetical protein